MVGCFHKMKKNEKYWQTIEQAYQIKIKEFEKSFIKRAYILHNVIDFVMNQNTAKKYDDVVYDTVYFLLKRAESLGVGVLAIWYNFSDLNDVSADGKCFSSEKKVSIDWFLDKLHILYSTKETMNDYKIVYNLDTLPEKALQEFRKKLEVDEILLIKLIEQHEFYELIT